MDHFQSNYPTFLCVWHSQTQTYRIFQPGIWQSYGKSDVRQRQSEMMAERQSYTQTEDESIPDWSELWWWNLISDTHVRTKRHNNNTRIETRPLHTISWTRRHIKPGLGSYTCTVVVLSVLVTLVLQVCGRHRKMYGPGCLCLPVKQKTTTERQTCTT